MRLSILERGTFKEGFAFGLLAGGVGGFLAGWFMLYGLIRLLAF